MRSTARRLTSAKAFIGYIILILIILNQVIGTASNLDFVLTAQGNSRLVWLWNFFASPKGNLLAVFLAALWLTALLLWPEKTSHAASLPASTHEKSLLEEGATQGMLVDQEAKRDVVSSDPKPSKTRESMASESIPILECREAGITPLYLNRTRNTLSDDREHGDLVSVATARFYYKPDKGSASWLDLKANIFFYDVKNVLTRQIYDAVWFKGEGEYVTLSQGHAHILIIGVVSKGIVIGFECNSKSHRSRVYGDYFAPNMYRLEGDTFRVQIDLIGKRGGETKVNKTFNFYLGLGDEQQLLGIPDPHIVPYAISTESIKNTAKRDYKIERLKDLIRQHSQLPNSFIYIDDPMFGMSSAFYAGAKRFLKEYYDEAHVERFNKEGVTVLERLLSDLLDS